MSNEICMFGLCFPLEPAIAIFAVVFIVGYFGYFFVTVPPLHDLKITGHTNKMFSKFLIEHVKQVRRFRGLDVRFWGDHEIQICTIKLRRKRDGSIEVTVLKNYEDFTKRPMRITEEIVWRDNLGLFRLELNVDLPRERDMRSLITYLSEGGRNVWN